MEANQSGEHGRPERPRRGTDRRRSARSSSCFFVFGTLPAVVLPLPIAVSSILNTFTLVWILTYFTDVSIDRAVPDRARRPRRRDRLRAAHDLPLPRRAAEGRDVETALVETMTHAGKAVIVSGSTVAIGLLSMVSARAVHPLDRHRRNADPGGVGARGDHAAPGAAGGARHADQQCPPAAEAARRPRSPRRRARGGAGREFVNGGRYRVAAARRSRSPACSSSTASS